MILGIDEAGRGPWAGPLVVGAVVLGGAHIDGLTDSKKLTKKKRELLYEEIRSLATAYASGWVSSAELDAIGMSAALRLATRRAIEQLKVPYSEIIIDGTVNFLADTGKGAYVTTMPKADLLVPSVSAASIVAKVERDKYMEALDKQHPGYGFKTHAGYGVAKHREAIARFGVTPEHRLSFAPLANYRSPSSASLFSGTPVANSTQHTTRAIGDEAENAVTEYLRGRGHEVLERNWRTKFCEIDIVSKKEDTIFFVEVKYRKSAIYGDGMAMITPKKVSQMQFAARLYAHSKRLSNSSLRLAAAAVTGDPPIVMEYVEIM